MEGLQSIRIFRSSCVLFLGKRIWMLERSCGCHVGLFAQAPRRPGSQPYCIVSIAAGFLMHCILTPVVSRGQQSAADESRDCSRVRGHASCKLQPWCSPLRRKALSINQSARLMLLRSHVYINECFGQCFRSCADVGWLKFPWCPQSLESALAICGVIPMF